MVYKCCAPNCKGNYSSENKKVHTFKFPNEPDLRSKWIHFIRREKTFTVTKHTRLCENHFKPEDIVKYEKIFDRQKNIFVENTLQHPYLKPDVIPSVLPHCPKYCSKMVSNRKSLSERLKEKEDANLIRCINESVQSHQQRTQDISFSNLIEFREKIQKMNGEWNRWQIVDYENEVVFIVLTREPIVKVNFSVIVDSECNVCAFNDVAELSKFRGKLTDLNQFEQLLNNVRSFFDGDESRNINELRIKNYISAIESALNEIGKLVPDEEKKKSIHFLVEQK